MVARWNRCMGFKKSRKSKWKKCVRRRGQHGRGVGSFLKKARRLAKKAIKSDIDRAAISKSLEHALALYNKGTSKIKNKKVKA